jgi:hypothetical protein
MNLIELNRSLVQLRLSGMAAVLETRLLQAQSESMAPIDLIFHPDLRRTCLSQQAVAGAAPQAGAISRPKQTTR